MGGVMTRVNKLTSNTPTMKMGIGGNYYVFCNLKEALEEICRTIGKSTGAIYFHNSHNCWVFRVKSKQHKRQLITIGV